ncbi:helix-turn-helix domain-containing protein [Vibrio parahaemolyticus]|uniref:helix-turn-helix domain-containing protein n=1 Tax=Vibrio parahaemolyticus TaxID=670 RepID=UPI001B8319B3|nr:helix-turn-helix transcriptional regulator [Vibrio parahaemolyticus]EGQ8112612.1 helix-turn-helix transcriptional regulator [Vibrio parahaemolyticus]EGQ8200324.1 helix-turn-helix transcriptional regulator [Vibrio parahaemolyticus]EGU0150432.1 helix-turn-helix transcriptional regulator [Vibrio parahaemolyticus]EHA6962166.1 helix-turn-helix transcriptional regulator [Vibrio parahaemolyticus]EHA6976544.1 helix-turn-helix transcriptional regulator [Vibrio parahaemolyticus]
MDYLNMSIGETLKNRRIELGIKQEAVAEEMGVTVQTIYKWEKGTTEPKASQVSKLGKVLKLTEKEICQGKQDDMDLDEMEFIRRVGILMNEVPQTEMLFGMHQYINDKKGFLKMLAGVSEYPYELFDEEELAHTKQMLKWAENGDVTFKSDEEKDYMIKLLKKEIEKKSRK